MCIPRSLSHKPKRVHFTLSFTLKLWNDLTIKWKNLTWNDLTIEQREHKTDIVHYQYCIIYYQLKSRLCSDRAWWDLAATLYSMYKL